MRVSRLLMVHELLAQTAERIVVNEDASKRPPFRRDRQTQRHDRPGGKSKAIEDWARPRTCMARQAYADRARMTARKAQWL
jgi:hypothetical protein